MFVTFLPIFINVYLTKSERAFAEAGMEGPVSIVDNLAIELQIVAKNETFSSLYIFRSGTT